MKVHKGIRPISELITTRTNNDKFEHQERLDNGNTRLWSNKMLNSGCDNDIEEIVELGGLIFCPYCDEYFSENQFEESE